METFVSPVEYSRAWSKSRKSEHPARFIQIEPRLSLTGANADTWLNCKPGTEILIALAVIKELLNRGVKGNAGYETLNNLHELTAAVNLETVASQSGIAREKIISAAGYLAQAKSSLVIAGGVAAGNNALALQSLVALINVLLGNVGKTVKLDRVRKVGTDFAALRSLIAEVEKGEHVLMFVDGSNPIFTLPSSYNLSLALQKLDLLVVCSSNIDETAALADIILPISSALESWGDSEPCEGINNLTQPAMAPIFNTRSLGDIFIGIDKSAKKSLGEYADFLAYLKNSWVAIQRANSDYGSFDSFWDVSVERGGAFRSVNAVSASYVNSKVFDLDFKVSEFSSRKLSESNSLVLLPFSSVRSFDGRAANRPWMQEIPDPITQIAWDSWAEINPKTARKLNLKTGDLVKVSNYFGEVNVPAYITEYVNENVIAVPIGNGHTELGRYASSVKGGNVINLIDSEVKSDFNGVPLLSANVALRRARGKHTLVITQGSDSQLGRDLARTKHLGHGESHDSGHGAHGAAHHEPEQMYEQRVHPLYRWGLAVDLAACNGCSACVAACYSENNIPTVGKRTMSKGREMTWLRIERYHDGSAEELQVSFLPMMCQHCNNAPCEPVCPVYATYHTEEGLNAMIYNRCVGTRYCSNNCTYKVRRFNWYEFSFPTPLDLQLNPDVMKRTAGVMEKCTFCVQRIAEVKDKAKDAGRPVLDGEVKPACVQSCPTEALVFGDLNDPNSRVSKLAKNQRAYKVLDHHLNTQPAVTYLEDVKYKA
jgi:Fe-S-cluster-containing dehydrogenase component